MDTTNQNHDKFLFSLIQQGNKDAFNMLFRYYYSGLLVFAIKHLQNKAEAEEIVQEVFLKIWSDKEQIHIHTSVRDFLFRAVKNKCLDNLKHKKVQEKFAEMLGQTNPAINHSELLVEQELRDLIKQTMEKLPSECRKVFVLSRIQKLKYREIAVKLGISVKTVENQISKALKVFRNELKDYL